MMSIVTATGDQSENTKEWRLAWWDTIIGYTTAHISDRKGYGSISDDDGQVSMDVRAHTAPI
jgi:hypothetical protein